MASKKLEIEIAARNTAGPVIKGVADDMAAIAPAADKAKGSADGALNSMHQGGVKAANATQTISDQLALVQKAYLGLQAAQGAINMVKGIAETADQYNNLSARIKLTTGEGAAFTSAFEQVSAIALRTSSNIESTGNLFAKLAEAGKSAGLGTQAAIAQALALTETVNQAVQLSGASAGASDAAITQLIQGLQGGVLRGDEFNSVMEQSPRLAKALADGLGTTTGELRKMAEAGQLSSDTVIKALQGQADVVAGEFSKLPPTVGRAIQNLSTSWTLYVGETDKATGASSLAASAIGALANNLNTIGGYLLDAGQAAAAFVAIKLAQHFTAMALAAVQATTAVVANTAAVSAAGAAGTTAAAGVGRLVTIMRTLRSFTLLGIVTNFKDIGTWIGEASARLAGYKDRTDELATSDRASAQIAADTVTMRKRMADATQAAIDKNFELSKGAKAAIAEFDKLTKEGTSAAEAVAKIGKDFDLGTVPGIVNATAVLDKLVSDGKLSASQFQAAWGDALKGADLAVFETNARVAFAGTAREAERLGQVLDATLRESIKRTGLDFDVISGGMGKASISAINDTEAMIQGLDRLQAMGVDTAQVLSASIGKGINTADSQRAIEILRGQIEAVRKVLGDKIADGLLDQAKQKADALKGALDAALPGINSVAEAMKTLGVTSDQTFKDTAAKSAAAYQTMKESGTASARELQDAFKKYASDAIAANGGVASSGLQSEAAMRGMEVTVDRAGKAIVRSMDDGRDATDRYTGSVRTATVATQEQIKAAERLRQVTSDGLKANKDGSAAGTFGNMLPLDLANKLKRGIDSGQAVDMTQADYDAAKKQARDALDFLQEMSKLSAGSVSSRAMQDAQALVNATNTARVNITDKPATSKPTNQTKDQSDLVQFEDGSWTTKDKMATFQSGGTVNTDTNATIADLNRQLAIARGTGQTKDALDIANDINRLSNGQSVSQPTTTVTTTPAKSYTVNIIDSGQSRQYSASTDADAQALIGLLQRAKLSA